ncbi:MAG: AAA family ATPase [Spirochaetota bacterium]
MSPDPTEVGKTSAVAATLENLLRGLRSVIKGKDEFLKLLVATFVAGGHALIEDAPGLGKTTVARTLAMLVGGARFKRIQFTPDLLPYDITGVDVFDPKTTEFVFRPGPIFADIVLADEINRSTPKVQSALLEVMAESQVTVGTSTHLLGPLFFVIATQNPIEIEGTYPLPVAQIDRFMTRLRLGYPDEQTELEIVRGDPSHRVMPGLQPVCTMEEVVAAHERAERVHCEEQLMAAAVRACRETRDHRGVEFGASPRGALMLVAASRAHALLCGRDYCSDTDFLALAPAVIAHRLKLRDHRISAETLARELMARELDRLGY